MGRPRRIGGYAGAGAALLALASATASYGGAARQTGGVPSYPAIVATARGSVPVYHTPGASRAFVTYSRSNGYHQPRVFLVSQRKPGWEKVYLPQRPNGSAGWVRDSSVTLAYDRYRVVVSLGTHRIRVYKNGRLFISRKAGVGRSVSATPRGTYFLVMLLKQPHPRGLYGPYAFGTSAFSNTYYHFGGGPGEIGLHGTNYPQGLGTNVSHGCIRVSNATIRRLAQLLPLGTPVVITR
jgi:lipoprotein-anchoring transpeptidase ErfK/SrfK